jgi:hypothetical protein
MVERMDKGLSSGKDRRKAHKPDTAGHAIPDMGGEPIPDDKRGGSDVESTATT